MKIELRVSGGRRAMAIISSKTTSEQGVTGSDSIELSDARSSERPCDRPPIRGGGEESWLFQDSRLRSS